MAHQAWAALLLLSSTAFAAADGSSPAQSPAPAAKPEPDRFAVGINDLGGQLRLRVTTNWALEARFMMGSASSNEGHIQSMVAGLRGYRFFQKYHRCRLYLGLEGDYAQTSIHGTPTTSSSSGPLGESAAQQSNFGNTSGYAGGGFAGLELRPMRRVALDMDMGPYMIDQKEKTTGATASDWDFVVNAAVNFYLF